MFGRKEKAALAALPPQHHALAVDRVLAVTQPPAAWADLFASLAHHAETVHRHPLDPRIAEVIVPLVRVLSEDVAPDGPIGLRLDLRGPDAPGKASPAHPLPPSRPGVLSAEETLTWDPWLVLEATLRTKAVVDLTVVDAGRNRRVRKRSASGKTKTKTKSRRVQRITGKLTLPRGQGFATPAPSAATGWLQVTAKPKGDRNVIIARAKVAPPAGANAGWQLNTLLLVLAELFRWTVPLEAGAAGGAPPGAAPTAGGDP